MYYLRWFAVVPMPIIGFFLAAFIVGLWNFVFGLGDTSRFFEYAFQPGFAGFGSVYLCALVAPSHRMFACIYGIVIVAMMSGLAAFSAISTGEYGMLVIVLFSLIGGGIAFAHVREDYSDF